MEDEESERQRKLKAGREKLLQFQQKKSAGKKKKKTSSKCKSQGDGVQQPSAEIGGNSSANSEQNVSIASDTDKDVSSIASEVEEQIAPPARQELQLFTQSEGDGAGGGYVSESCTSGDESFTSEDGGLNDLAIANLERNELKNRTVELEEELAAKKTALKEISKENTELRSKLEDIAQASFGNGQANIVQGLNERISSLEKNVDEKQSLLQELQKENSCLKKRVEEFQDLDRSESSQVEELKGKLTTKQVTLDELNKQNEELSHHVQVLQVKLSESPNKDISAVMENLKIKENSVQQLSVENEQQRSVIQSLQEHLNQSNMQVQEYNKTVQLKDQELQQVASSWKEYLSQNWTKFNEQLSHKEQQLNEASQEILRLQQVIQEKETTREIAEDSENKISELAYQLEEKNTAMEILKSQAVQLGSKLKQGEEEVILLKTHVQEQTEQLISMQETLDDSNTMHEEKDNKISSLEQQLDSLTQSNEDMSNRSQTIAEQMVELRNVMDERNQRISRLELNLSEVTEERELLKSEMTNQTQELLKQVKDLRAQLEESNAKVREQSDEMENSFSELHVTKDMIKDLQKEMLEKDLALDNTSQKLQNNEEILEQIQKKFVEEKERLQNELNEKDKVLEETRILFSEELNKEKVSGTENLKKIENLSVEIENYQKQAKDLRNAMAEKDETIEDFKQRFDESKQRHYEEVESLKLELEYMKEGASDSGQKVIEISEKYQEQLKLLQMKLDESEKQIHELNDDIKQRDVLVADAENGQAGALQRVQELEEKLSGLREAEDEHQNEVDMLKHNHAEEMVNIRHELDQLKSSSLAEQARLADDMVQEKNKFEQEICSLNELNNELNEKLTAAKQQQLEPTDDAFGEESFASLKEQLQHQEEEYDKIKKLYESLELEKEGLLAEQVETKNELSKYQALQSKHEKDVDQLHQNIQTLENELARLQDSEERLLKEKADFVNLLQETEGGNEQKVVMLTEKLQQAEEEHERELALLEDKLQEAKQKQEVVQAEKDHAMDLSTANEEKVNLLEKRIEELRESQDKILLEKQQAIARLQESEGKINETEEEHEDKVQQLEGKLQEVLQDLETAVTKQQETEKLLQRSNEERQEQAGTHESEIKELYNKLQEAQKNQDQSLAKQQETAGLLQKVEEQFAQRTEEYENELRKLNESLQELLENRSVTEQLQKAEEEFSEKTAQYEHEKKLLEDKVAEMEVTDARFLTEKEELQNLLNKTQSELLEKQGEHENEIKQMDEQLEQTRQVIESIRSDNDSKIANLEESLRASEEEFQRKLQEKENEYQELLQSLQSEHEDVKSELEKSKIHYGDLQKQLKSLVSEKEELMRRGKDKDWNSNTFEQQPVVEESVTSSDNWMDVQGETEDGWDWSVPDENIPNEPKQVSNSQKSSINEIELLERIALLQEKLAEKEKSEVQLIEEKNKLVNIVKEYNDTLTNERDSLRDKMIDQDETIKNLQEQLSMSELVSSDIQQVFAQQLLVLEKQRDSLLNQLDEEQKERSSFVDILEEKHALEENLRSEKELLADKLRQKDLLEKQLEDERAALQEQLVRQARLNEIIREKDLLEQELTEQKNRLQLELSAIEESLLAKEQLLEQEKNALRQELLEKETELETWQGEVKTKEEQERAQRELLEKNFTSTLLATRTELEDTYQQNLEHLRTELEDSFKQRLFDVNEDFQAHHNQEMASLSRKHEQQIDMWYELSLWLLQSVSERECFQIVGVKAEYEEKIKNLKRMLEEQRQRQVTTMKSVLERDREHEVQHLMDSHDNDMEKLKNELNLRHQDIVNAIVARLKQTHEQQMEDCLANAVTDTVLKVEVARLEVEKEYEAKFNELRENSENEIEKIRKMNEDEVSKLEAQYKGEVEKRELLEKQHGESSQEERVRYDQNMEKELSALREKLHKEHEENIDKMREDIEEEYENQVETLQDELEEKYEKDLRELREELDKQGHEITASAIEELQRKHFLEIDALKAEHEQIYAQISSAREKEKDSHAEDLQTVTEKLEQEKARVKELSRRVEEIQEESKEEESEKVNVLQTTMEKKTSFLEQQHQEKVADLQNELETKLKAKDDELNEQLRSLRNEFEKEKKEMDWKYSVEIQELSNNNDKKFSDKEQQHISEIMKLQQKLALVQEENEEKTFQELEENRKQLSEKFQKDLDAIVRELNLKHQKQIDHLISEAESNQTNAERDVFETWKLAIFEKHENEMRELRTEHQKELETTRVILEKEKLEEVERVSGALNAKSAEELKELHTKLTNGFEEELEKSAIEHQTNFDNEINKLVTRYQLLREQHEATVRELDIRLNSTLAAQIEPMNDELRKCKDLLQEKEMEIENLKRQHEIDLKELKQRNFDDLLEEVSEVRADLALDAAREVEIVKLEADYVVAKKIKEVQDAQLKEIAELKTKVESLEKDKKALDELLRSHAEETRELQERVEMEKNELGRLHNAEIQDLKMRLDVEQQNSLNELKGKLMKEMDDMQESWKKISEEEHREMVEKFSQREAEIKENELKERKEIVNNLKNEQEQVNEEITEDLRKEHEVAVQELRNDYEGKIKEIEDKLVAENENLIREKDEALEQANEQYHRELEAMKQELVKTHMEKFTSMTEELDKSHQEELQSKLKEAEEMARYNLEQEHLESLKKLEEDLQKKHEEQLKSLNDLVEQHRAQIKKLSEDHVAEKQQLEEDWQKKHAEELIVLKNEQREEMLLKEKLLDKAETEIKRAVLEIETKDKNINEMTEFIEKTSDEYEERLAKISKEFEDRLQDIKTNTGSSYEEQLRGFQEMISKQHAEELERLKAEHDTHLELANNELEGERALKSQMQEELERKLTERTTTAAEQENILKIQVKELEKEIAELKERNDTIQVSLEEKEKIFAQLQEQKQAVEMDVRTLEGHVRDIENREERQQRENANLIQMLRADLDAMNSERDSIERAKAKLLQQLTAAVRTTMAIEDTITSRLETLFEQTVREDDDETVSEVASLPEADDSIPEGFRRRQATGMLASSTPAAPAGMRHLDDSDENERTVTEDKQVDQSLLSDEGLEVSVILSDNQGSLDAQNDETVVDSGNRLRVAVKKLLDIVTSVSRQLNDARKTQDELLNTTSQRTEELNQLTQAQNVLMLRLQEEIETKDDVTNRLRSAEEEMEVHIANVERLENVLKEKENERLHLEETDLEERNAETQRKIEELLKEKKELQNGVESLKSKSEEMEKTYEKEKQLLCDKITELQTKVKESESEPRLHLAEDSNLGLSAEWEDALPEEKPATPQSDDLKAKIESLEEGFKNKEKENIQLKEEQEELSNELSRLNESKAEMEKELRDKNDEFLKHKQGYEQEIERLRATKHEIHGNEELLKENELLKKEVSILKMSVKSLTSDLQNVTDEKGEVQNAFQEAEIVWEEEKNNLQQQLYDSCLEASSFKDRLNKMKQEAENVSELQEKLSKQNEAYTKLETNACSLENEVTNLKKSLGEKETQVDTLTASVEELKEGLLTQQNILEEHHAKLIQAGEEKVLDEDEIRKLKDALGVAETNVEDGEAKMQEILRNMKNLESTYKAQTIEVTRQLNEKVDALQEELREARTKLDQEKQSNIVIRNHINDLKEQHMQEMSSCKSQFETDIKYAIERVKSQQTDEGQGQDFAIPQQSSEPEPDSYLESRLNNELKNVDGFTKTIAGYLSELKHESFSEDEDFDTSTTEKIETVLDDLRLDANAVYNLVNSLPAFHDPNIQSLQTAWEEEKEMFRKALELLNEEAASKPDEVTMGKEWRGVVVSAVLDVLKKQEDMLTSELETIDLAASNDVISTSNLIRRRQQKQNDLHRQSVDRLYEADRISLLSEIDELKKSIVAVKQELSNENHKLQEQLKAIQQQVRKREKELLHQVTSKEEQLQKERELLDNIQDERRAVTKQLNEANNLLESERNAAKDLQDILNKNKTRLKEFESALEKERTHNTVIQKCLDSEIARSSNLEQALKHERLNVDSREREVEKKSELLQELTNREHETIKDLEKEVLLGKKQLSELETKLREEKATNAKLETELAKKQNVPVSDDGKLKNLINDLRGELEKTKSENVELVASLNEERQVSEDLKSGVESLQGVNEQIAEQERLITELSEALENERRVNEELRNALDNDYEETDKTDDRQTNVVKELQVSLTAVQEQLRNQINVVDQERNRVKRLRKERDIHEASALGARTKERNLERELEKEKAAREMEVGNLKDLLEHEIALKRNLEDVLSARNTELETVSRELQCSKDDRKMAINRTPPNSPSKDRLNILRHDLKSIVDEHRVLLIMHKEYVEKQLKKSDNSPEVSGLYSQLQNLSHEMDRMKKQVGAVSEGSPIRLSPIKTAAYDRIVKQNKEMSDYLAKLTDEKSELRSTLSHLELQISQYRDREASHLEDMRRNRHEMETMLATERTRATQDRLTLHQTVEGQKRKLNELHDKLLEREMEVDQTRRSLQVMEDQVERHKTISAKRLQSSESFVSHWTPARIQKLYARYIKAEKSRKSLIYQKKYLVLLLGGFRENETKTLALIAKMGAYPSYHEPTSRFSAAFTKFRTAVRVVVATKRMQFLVAKSRKSIRQVMESVDSKSGSQRNTHLSTKSGNNLLLYARENDVGRPNYRQRNTSDPLRFEANNINGSEQGDISMDPKDSSFAEIYSGNIDTAVPKHTHSAVYSAFDYKPTEIVTRGTYRGQLDSGPMNRLDSRNLQSMPHSPPVRERPNSQESQHSSIRPPFSAYQREPRRDVRTALHFDSEDLDRKIQTLDNLQQKLSLNRGTKDR